jgi:hypothetical protein
MWAVYGQPRDHLPFLRSNQVNCLSDCAPAVQSDRGMIDYASPIRSRFVLPGGPQKPVSDHEGCFSLECTVYIHSSNVGTTASDSESFCYGHRLRTVASSNGWRVSSFWFKNLKVPTAKVNQDQHGPQAVKASGLTDTPGNRPLTDQRGSEFRRAGCESQYSEREPGHFKEVFFRE